MFRRLFLPATLFMNKLRFNLKFTLIVLLFLLPLIILAINYFSEVNNLSRHTRAELSGVKIFSEIDLQQRKLLSVLIHDMAWRSGQTVPPEQTARLQQFIQQLPSLANEEYFTDDQLTTFLAALTKSNARLSETTSTLGNPQWSAVDHFDLLETALTQFNNLYFTTANLKGLTNDPQVDTVMISRLLAEKRLLVLSQISRSYGVAAYAVGEGEVSSGTFDSLSIVSDRLAGSNVLIKNIASFGEGLDQQLQQQIAEDVDSMLKVIDAILIFLEDQFLVADEVTLNSADLDAFFEQQLNTYYLGGQRLSGELTKRLKQRLSDNSVNMMTVSLIVSAVLLIVIYLFVGMSFSISMTTNSLTNVAQKLADGDTRVSASVRTKDELSNAIKAFNKMAIKVNKLVDSVQVAAHGVAQQSHDVEQLANQTGDAVNTQLQDTQSITAAISELLDAVATVSENTHKVVEALNRANQQTQQGKQQLADARQATNELGAEIKLSVDVTNKLSQQSDSINQVLDVIKNIAEQTNLLALNAAIEAARAGEQGRGFAVVADEVRSLAKRTHESIEEIQTTITSLQQGVSDAVDAMTRSDKKALRSVEESAKLDQALDHITEAVEEISQQNSATEQASQQQQQIASQIDSSLNSISQISTVTENNVEQSISASQQLAEHVAKLEDVISNFKT
ncbi:methyl-accepting chemotaxis protein [Aliikangiella coralliicola]|uniref:Methyl-accepting chemotaxis protein n=2 Tax=Aliikangiella coralliicola TaxID=2592383 RepID=A0A545UG26_9GAMM|nr:methyl-accepting chemotaxis protein [Aliikangiella coralliicola]